MTSSSTSPSWFFSKLALLDTNVLVYAYDTDEPKKQQIAQEIIAEAVRVEKAILSAQVLGEFFTVVTRRIATPMSSSEASRVIDCLAVLPVQEIDLPMVRRAVEVHERYQIHYWDALLVATAERASCTVLLTEDLSDGQEYCGVRVANPFRVDDG